MTTVRVTLDQARAELERMRVKNIPMVLKRSRYQLALNAKRHADINVSGAVLRTRSGSLKKYVAMQPIYQDGELTHWGLPAGEKEARIGAFQETGGTIVPKVAKMLRIPLRAAQTAAGVDRYAGRRLRTAPGFFIYRSGDGRLSLLRRTGTKVEAWYSLVFSATIRAHPWFGRAVDTAYGGLPAIMDQLMREELDL
jgi:hypothetical protein